MARSYESLWLWLGSVLGGVGVGVLGIAATLESASKVSYSLWTSAPAIVAFVMFGVSLVCFVCAIREVSIRWPVSHRSAELSAAISQSASSVTGQALPSEPVRVRLVPELDMMTGGFRLVALNRGQPGCFRAEVTSILDQDGQPPVTTAGGWPVPWLDDGTVASKDIPTAGSPRLDFAYFSISSPREALEGTREYNGDHWTFPSLPATVKVSYPAARASSERGQFFYNVNVRVTRDDPPGHVDARFKIGVEGQEPYCRELTAGDAVPEKLAESEPLSSAPEVAVTDRWTSGTQFASYDLLQLQSNIMSHPAYMRRSSQEPSPASVRVGIVIASAQLPRDIPPTSEVRASFLAFLARHEVMDLVAGLTDATGMTWKPWDERPRLNFAAVLSSSDENEVPAAWARLLPPETGASHFGRDPRRASFVLHIEPRTGPEGGASPAGLAEWHQRFALAVRLPAALAEHLTSDLGLATSGDPQAQVAVWLKSHSMSLTDLVDVNNFTVVPGVQASWFIGLARADPEGQDANALARTWTAEICDAIHLDGHETVLRSLGAS